MGKIGHVSTSVSVCVSVARGSVCVSVARVSICVSVARVSICASVARALAEVSVVVSNKCFGGLVQYVVRLMIRSCLF